MEDLLKEYESCLQAIYDKQVSLLPDGNEVVADKRNKYLIPFSIDLDEEAKRIGEELIPKLASSDISVFIDRAIVIRRNIYQQYMGKLESVKTS